MTLQISTITDKNIRKAAQEADSQGTRAFNGILDKEEVSLFIKYAKNMNCNMTEVMNIANRIGVDKNTQSTINRETQITNLKDKINNKKQLLQSKMKEYENIKQKPTTAQYVGRTVGGAATAVLGAAIVLTALSGPIGWTCAAVAAGTAWLPGYVFGDCLTQPNEEDYDYKVNENNIKNQKEKFYKTQIEPLNREIESLQMQLSKL